MNIKKITNMLNEIEERIYSIREQVEENDIQQALIDADEVSSMSGHLIELLENAEEDPVENE